MYSPPTFPLFLYKSYLCTKYPSIWHKTLPLGIQDFRKIIENDFKYVDKTRYIYEMCRTPGAYFLSRPRRFGKSITLAVLQELYPGSRDLFKGLWIADKWDWNRKYPVIRISFTALGFAENGLQASLSFALDELIRENQIPAIQGNISNKFTHLIKQLAKKTKLLSLLMSMMRPSSTTSAKK